MAVLIHRASEFPVACMDIAVLLPVRKGLCICRRRKERKVRGRHSKMHCRLLGFTDRVISYKRALF